MLLEQTLDKLNAMKLFALAKSLAELLERQDHQSLCPPSPDQLSVMAGLRSWYAEAG
jgi:hypothetical protein